MRLSANSYYNPLKGYSDSFPKICCCKRKEASNSGDAINCMESGTPAASNSIEHQQSRYASSTSRERC